MRSVSWVPISLVIIALLIAFMESNVRGLALDEYDDGTQIAQRTGINLASGTYVDVAGVDNPANDRVNFTFDIADGTDGEIITWDAAGDPTTVGPGTTGQVLTSAGAGAAPTFSSGPGWILQGANTTEATTTSTVETDLVTISSLSIPTTAPIWIMCSFSKTTGAADDVKLGVKLNATTVLGPNIATNTANAAREGVLEAHIPSYDANYDDAHWFLLHSSASVISYTSNGSRPNATVTDVVIMGLTDNAANTLGVDECYVYALTAS